MKNILFALLILYSICCDAQGNRNPWVTYKIVTGIKNPVTNKFELQKPDLKSRYFIFLLNDQIKIKDRNNSIYFIKEIRETKENDLETEASWWTYDLNGVDCAVETTFFKTLGIITVIVAYPNRMLIYYVRPLSSD